MSQPTPWPRPLLEEAPSPASVEFFVFAEAPLDMSEAFSRSRHGLPECFSVDDLNLQMHSREKSPDWFDDFFEGAMLNVARLDVGSGVEQLVCSTFLYRVSVEVAEPLDLAYLQAIWAVAKGLCERGATFVCDTPANTWLTAGMLAELDPLRSFSIGREVKLVFETEPTEGFGHLMHTRGMAKFGQPDIVLVGTGPADVTAGGALLNDLARRGAEGATLKAGQTAAPRGLFPRKLEPYEPDARHPQVHLNNCGLVLNVLDWGLSDLG